jgi:hypothetical protein
MPLAIPASSALKCAAPTRISDVSSGSCGNPSSAAYCSKACEAQDATPSLVTNLDSSGGSVWSTPPSSNPVSPFFGAQSDSGHVQNLELDGKATGLHFDYGYHVRPPNEKLARA